MRRRGLRCDILELAAGEAEWWTAVDGLAKRQGRIRESKRKWRGAAGESTLS